MTIEEKSLQYAISKIQEIRIAKNRDPFATTGDFEEAYLAGANEALKRIRQITIKRLNYDK